jgi:RES domain-containing protein
VTLTVYRITQAQYAASAFTGEGASSYPGRWNSLGTRIVYAAATVSLATLEILVHAEDYAMMQQRYLIIPARLDEAMVGNIADPDLPTDWDTRRIPDNTRRIGDRWAASMSSVALRVPSIVTRGEYNYLLNPQHPDFAKVTISPAFPLTLDPRLKLWP